MCDLSFSTVFYSNQFLTRGKSSQNSTNVNVTKKCKLLAYEVIKLAQKEMSQGYVFKQFGEFHFI